MISVSAVDAGQAQAGYHGDLAFMISVSAVDAGQGQAGYHGDLASTLRTCRTIRW